MGSKGVVDEGKHFRLKALLFVFYAVGLLFGGVVFMGSAFVAVISLGLSKDGNIALFPYGLAAMINWAILWTTNHSSVQGKTCKSICALTKWAMR